MWNGTAAGWRLVRWGVAGALLLIPAMAMRFGAGVNWSAFDFAVTGGLLAGALAAYEVALRASRSTAYRLGAALAAATALFLCWINLAVGIIGSEDHPANRLYLLVLATAGGGAVVARLRPAGLARAMVAAAAAQGLVGAVAVVARWGKETANWPFDVIGTSVLFCLLWLAAAGLFRRSLVR